MTAEVICGAAFAFCECGLAHAHPDPVHECFDRDCRGRWTYDASGTFIVVRLPMAWQLEHEHQAEEIYNAAVRLVDHMRMRRR